LKRSLSSRGVSENFQTKVEKNERPIDVGSIQVRSVARKPLKRVPAQSFHTPRGTLQVSTAEATAIDLAGYSQHAGGLDQVATVRSGLAEKIDAKRLVLAAARSARRATDWLLYVNARVEPEA
jgi:AbiEi antitoxin C-terminal domain